MSAPHTPERGGHYRTGFWLWITADCVRVLEISRTGEDFGVAGPNEVTWHMGTFRPLGDASLASVLMRAMRGPFDAVGMP